MKKLLPLIGIILLVLLFNTVGFTQETHSGQASIEATKASGHASKSAAHAIVASGQVTSAASAVPLAISGSVGAVSAEIAEDLLDAATRPIGEPLEITDENITVGPPPNEKLHNN